MRRSSEPSRPASAPSKVRISRRPSGRSDQSRLRLGTHAVEEALRAGRATRLLVQRDLQSRPRLLALQRLAAERGVPVGFVTAADLDALANNERHQGVAAEVEPFRYRSLAELLAAPGTGDPLFLALDGVEDPHNLGAILRSADAAGVNGVVVPERRAAPVTAAVARASAGALDHVPVAQVVNLTRALHEIKEHGVWVYGLDVDGEVVFDEADYARPLTIVAGAEGKGLSRLVRDACDLRLRIPLYGHVESLNVSVATALALFAARRARERADEGRKTKDDAPLV